MRGPVRPFTASKVSAWLAIDQWLQAIKRFRLGTDPAPWVKVRDTISKEVCERGFDRERNTFTQYYGSKELDGSLLMLPLSGFLPATDPRIVGTVEAIERDLREDGLVLRYRTDESNDGLSGKEGVFLPCSFWLARVYHDMGRHDDSRALFEKLIALRNDVGLLAEEYLPSEQRQVGNFPQAFSHLALIQAAYSLAPPREADKTRRATDVQAPPPPP
jgi:GH15 family glucan-1,4-alpha-glucosidase